MEDKSRRWEEIESQNPQDPTKEENQNGEKRSRRACRSSGVEEVSGEHETGSTRISRKLEVCTDGERMEWWWMLHRLRENEAAIDEGDDAGTSATTRI